jgi:hypothetical protein
MLEFIHLFGRAVEGVDSLRGVGNVGDARAQPDWLGLVVVGITGLAARVLIEHLERARAVAGDERL